MTTVADIVTADGNCIQEKISQVIGKIRDSQLLYLIQKWPRKDNIDQWQYLIHSISEQGKLHIPLGSWGRLPDQKFMHLINDDKTTVYKRIDRYRVVQCVPTKCVT